MHSTNKMEQNCCKADSLSVDICCCYGHDSGKDQNNAQKAQLPCMKSSKGGPDVNKIIPVRKHLFAAHFI